MSEFKKRFHRRKKIAEGQFGTVYEVEEKSSGQVFALKEICFNDKNKGIIEREIEIQGRFTHANLLRLESVYVESPYAFLVSELCKYDLRTFLQKSIYPLNPRLKRSLAKDILEGLAALHEQGIYHRDLKPGNILIDGNFSAKLCDFGSAIGEDERVDGRFGPEGFTLWYKAPELLMGERRYGAEIDVWSFGCIFAELLQGAPLFPCASDFELLGKFTTLLGEPTAQNWPGLEGLSNFGKVNFLPRPPAILAERFPGASALELDFLAQCVKYGARPSARALLSHDLLRGYRRSAAPQEFCERFVRAPTADFLNIFCESFS